MSYVVLARKYRPKIFDDVIGQKPVGRTLKNAIATNHVAHAYLFAGPRGVGKTSMARILAMALNCSSSEEPTPDPCGECASCTGIYIGEDVDVREIDGASNNGVDDVRTLRDNAGYHPAHSRFRIYIIDEVHMLTKEAFNALLKTLEEPPAHVKFIFATTEPNKIPETIQSRCQRFDFRNISTADIATRLEQICEAENVKAEKPVLEQIARRARGGMRDSQSLLDQVIAYDPDELTDEAVAFVLGKSFDEEIDGLLTAFADKDAAAALGVINSLIAGGRDLTAFLSQLIEALRTLMIVKACGRDREMLDLSPERAEKLGVLSDDFAMDTILYMLQVVCDADRKTRSAVEKRIVVETAVVKLASMEDLKPIDAILKELRSARNEGCSPAPKTPAPRRAARAEETWEADETPPPPKEPDPVKVTSNGPLGDVQNAWPRLLARVKRRHQRSVEAFLREGQPSELTDGMLTITFDEDHSFHREQLSERSRLDLLESCLSEVVGRPMKVKLVGAEVASSKSKGKDPTGKSGKGSKPGKAAKSPGVSKAVEMFGGRVVEEDR